MTTTELTGADDVAWDLSDLYAGPDDPRIDTDLDAALAAARAFAARLRGRVASLSASELAAALDELERTQEPAARAGVYSGLVFAADTATPRHGALVQHVQERATELSNELLFFELEWVAVAPERFDVGQRSNFIMLPMAIEALRLVRHWGTTAIQAHAAALWAPVLEVLRAYGYAIEDASGRGHHLVGLRAPDGADLDAIGRRLADRRVMVSLRGDAVRVSPHLYNTPDDMRALVAALTGTDA